MEKEKNKKNAEKLFLKKNYMSNFRANLYHYLKQPDMTIAKLSEMSNLSDGTLQTLLYGKSEDCKMSTVISIAKALNISVDELMDCGTIEDTVKKNMQAIRVLPPNARYTIRWFISHQKMLYKKDKRDGKKRISVIEPIYTNDGILKVTNRFRQIDISGLSEELQHKVFIGLRLSCDFLMPYYSPFDVLLLANDRSPFQREHVVVLIKNDIFLAMQKYEDGHYNYYGIRDGRFKCDESGIDEVIGYVTFVVPDTTEDGER